MRQGPDDLTKLLTELEWLPLAISQAATYIGTTKLSTAEYLEKLRGKKRRRGVLQRPQHDRYRRSQASNSVLDTWSISIGYIRQHSEMAYRILTALAYIDNQNISHEIIVQAAQVDRQYKSADQNSGDLNPVTVSHGSGRDDTGESDSDDGEEEVIAARTWLVSFSFLTFRNWGRASQGRAGCIYDMHKLVHEAIANHVHFHHDKRSNEARSAKTAFEIIDDLFPKVVERSTWSLCERYLRHAQRTEEWARVHNGEEPVSSLLSRVSDYLSARGRWKERELVDLKIVNLRERVFGSKHISTLSSRARLAVTYHEQGRYSEAESIKTEVLQLRRGVLGENHKDTIWSLAELAATYHRQQKYDKAEKIKTKVLQLRQQILGKKHEDTIRSMASLASIYHAQKRYSEAKKIYDEVLQLQRDVLGPKHPNTIESMASLASTYYALGMFEEDEEISFQVLRLRKEVLGDKHPDTIQSMESLATTYYKRKRYEEARELDIQVLHLRGELLGKNHPATIQSEKSLAESYKFMVIGEQRILEAVSCPCSECEGGAVAEQ
ncbi:hypothetical protein JX265_007909 [Neoarthrinium moseri]|uniref:Kinesin light chain n=1 Tax=Neoarthrinium moseri TaxID=1658444 RepID=A0A9Q0AMX3_9PEZI|nr:hypothetical protein JX265_007909 [Neoarthrinium moseri]